MRNLTAGNKMKFTIFTFIIMIIIVLLVGALIMVLKTAKEKYQVETSAFIYDNSYDYIELENPALISKKWTGKYYLKEDVTNKEYKLGDNVVSFDVNKKNIDLYGEFYQVLIGGDIKKFTGYNKVSNSSENKFYKMADRKYLIVAKNIQNDMGSLSMDNYLMIVIDKSGNALLLNNETNIKIINSIKLSTADFTFDVANEKLIFNNQEINLKKIIGSTNEYVENDNINNEQNNIKGNTNEEGDNNTNLNSSVVIANGSSVTTATTVATDDNQDTGFVSKLNGWATEIQKAFESIYNASENNNNKEEQNLSKSITLNKISAGSTYIDINYTVQDPESKYNVVYAMVSNNTTTYPISLDKTANTYRLENLSPNTSYTVDIGYKIVNADASSIDTVEDSMAVKTTNPSESLSIVKISISKIYCNLKIDSHYAYDYNEDNATELVLYNGDTKLDSYRLTEDDLKTATRSSGLTKSFTYKSAYKNYESLTIKLQGTYYENKPVSTALKAKMINY